ncbi:GntR family transcriptional regulator [Companilactobacillus alimentarius]|uniref:GntR family transcriptional regulator n=1 Tax=Companilactobacillus alimentarius TaxID=1602 RepID=UPI0028BBD969|nr:GntR family transcriptional regulator [Companilactobacillus alimentarius]MDT6953370.1 GntR family transcriptional regulator [Companilactobacillus alimentarius]
MEPKYKLIYQTLKNNILNQKYSVGDKLPSENQLAQDYKVSRITSKRALSELENDDLVTRQAGIGTIVKKRTLGAIPKSEIIFVIPFSNNTEFGDYTSGILQIFNEANGFQLTTINNHAFRDLPLDRLRSAKGIIYYVESIHLELPTITKLYLNNIPIILLDKSFEDLPIPCVTSDNFAGGSLATKELLKYNHKNLTYLTSKDSLNEASVRSRYFGFLSILRREKILPAILQTDFSDNNINQLIENIKSGRIDGIVAENDIIAIKLMNELRNHGIKIPQQLSIIGFDNIQASKLSYPALTTINQDFVSLGKTAATILLKLIQSPDIDPQQRTTIPVKLIKRQSIKI